MSTRFLFSARPAPIPVRILSNAVDASIVLIGSLMVLIVFGNVVTHILGKDIAWTTEFCEFLMVWGTFLGGASAARRGTHMSITEFLDKLSPQNRRMADGAIQIVALAVLAILVKYGIVLMSANWGNTLTVLGWPMALQYMALPVGSGAMFVFVAYDFFQILRGTPREVRYEE